MIYVVISAAVAFILNIPFYSAVESIVKDVSEGKVYFKREVNQLMDNFQTYVNNNGIRADDGDDIAKWNSDNDKCKTKITCKYRDQKEQKTWACSTRKWYSV